jgi:hypothetical protein
MGTLNVKNRQPSPVVSGGFTILKLPAENLN